MAIPYQTAKFKLVNILQWQFGAQLPNLIPANISGYNMVCLLVCACMFASELMSTWILGWHLNGNKFPLHIDHVTFTTIVYPFCVVLSCSSQYWYM